MAERAILILSRSTQDDLEERAHACTEQKHSPLPIKLSLNARRRHQGWRVVVCAPRCTSPPFRGTGKTETRFGDYSDEGAWRSCGIMSRARTHKSGSVSPARLRSASFRTRLNCCIAAKCRGVPTRDTFYGASLLLRHLVLRIFLKRARQTAP